jgi:hypothetical protein
MRGKFAEAEEMKRVTGFLADDGTYFDAKADAELYEALHALEFSVRNIGADPVKFMIVVEGCQEQLRRYLDAKAGYEKSEATGPRPGAGTAPDSVDHANDSRTEAAAPVLEQSLDEHQHVPDVRSGISTEAVRDNGPVDGAGGGSVDARSVRRAPHMATTSSAAIAAARPIDSNTFVRQAEAREKLLRSNV